MNKDFTLKLKKDKNYTKEEKKIIESIIEAMQEIERARTYFQMVKDPRLVDYAIYMEEAAKAKYMYLLSEAKNKKIKIQYKYMLQEINIV
ncbi:putative outer membrane protein [Clostridium tetanomorphum]|uniref:DUF2508 family protein n=1 Tax=Clostridium tetanomorphum TaxID=1553 RepID=A0A923EBB8_CLOTT|nr:DUF2508 family protein [Clostridium tetanomorphum]KAJ50804.1 hypothetical protein CTM_16096 [Clostridium tetanomorphum DSM 665]MBC2399943.1 DUF2508 family protein [Clostridium tetanomorphum]MBP1866455.1 putative outer membrane protein [Clostridium tetanomorphum]NRS86658.1 putative outer membrane protein [Clostridium tetanomorphum]NRZ95338.1 putative outer membrane protein [Clostridium tetanomorphum]